MFALFLTKGALFFPIAGVSCYSWIYDFADRNAERIITSVVSVFNLAFVSLYIALQTTFAISFPSKSFPWASTKYSKDLFIVQKILAFPFPFLFNATDTYGLRVFFCALMLSLQAFLSYRRRCEFYFDEIANSISLFAQMLHLTILIECLFVSLDLSPFDSLISVTLFAIPITYLAFHCRTRFIESILRRTTRE